jgi:hypothetical protein
MDVRLPTFLAIIASIVSVTAQADPILIPTGGTLVGVTPATVDAAYGSFSAVDTTNIQGSSGEVTVTDASVSGTYTDTGLSLGSSVNTFYENGHVQVIGADSGTIGFTLTAATLYQIIWSSGFPNVGGGQTATASLTVTGSAGNVVLSCSAAVSASFGNGGGCLAGPGASLTSGGLVPTLRAALAPDTYSVAFSNNAGYMFGTPVGSGFSFSATAPVPLPNSLALLLAGLAAMGGALRIARSPDWTRGQA